MKTAIAIIGILFLLAVILAIAGLFCPELDEQGNKVEHDEKDGKNESI
jgi:hypothetical protein